MLPKIDKRFHANHLSFLDSLGVSCEEFGELFTEEVQALPPDEQAIMKGFNWLTPNTITEKQFVVFAGIFSRVIEKVKQHGARKPAA